MTPQTLGKEERCWDRPMACPMTPMLSQKKKSFVDLTLNCPSGPACPRLNALRHHFHYVRSRHLRKSSFPSLHSENTHEKQKKKSSCVFGKAPCTPHPRIFYPGVVLEDNFPKCYLEGGACDSSGHMHLTRSATAQSCVCALTLVTPSEVGRMLQARCLLKLSLDQLIF